MADGEGVVDQLETLAEPVDAALVEFLERGGLAAGAVEHDDDDREDDEVVDEGVAHVHRDGERVARRRHEGRDRVERAPGGEGEGKEAAAGEPRGLPPPRPERDASEYEHRAVDARHRRRTHERRRERIDSDWQRVPWPDDVAPAQG